MADRYNERPGDRTSSGTQHLARLEELDDYEVADGEPDIRGWTVRTADGRDAGKVDTLIADTAAMQVRYIDVEVNDEAAGSEANRHVLVPIGAARLDDDADVVFVDRMPAAGLRGAPRYGHGGVTSEDELSIREYYRPGFSAAGRGDRDEDYYDHSRFFGGRRRGREDARYLTRSEEELAVGTRAVKQGEVDVHKRIETEHVKKQVPVSHEEVRVERHAARPGASATPQVREGEIRVPVMAEEVVVDKRAVPKEEIVISKETVRDTKTVEADLKKERIDVDRTKAGEARDR